MRGKTSQRNLFGAQYIDCIPQIHIQCAKSEKNIS